MIPEIGYIVLLIAFITSIYAALAAWYGGSKKQFRWVESARNATIAIWPLVILASALLITSLLRNDFSLDYVWQVSSREMPTYLKVTALWGGQAGSLMFWTLLMSTFTAFVMMRKWHSQRELMPNAIIVANMTLVFFLFINTFIENPFSRLDVIPVDGRGLNPLLRHPGMIIHPPMLYLGFTGFVIPYIFAMAALMSGKVDDEWIKTTRRWSLVAWLLLSLGNILGSRWAYDVLGWGGYWAWDPVENASFMPWLAGTAFLHSVIIQEKRNMFKMWNMFLVVLTFSLVMYGTFIVRSGVISSVHSFARSAIGPLFFIFIAVMFVFSTYWVNARRNLLTSKNSLQSFLSREAAFLYNNFLILAILAVIFFLTNYPILSELFTGEKGFVGPPVYEQALAPLFALLVLLMGLAPLTMWYRTTLKRLELRVRYPVIATSVFVIVLYALGVRGFGALTGFWIVTFSLMLTILEFGKGTRARMKKGESLPVAFNKMMAQNRRRYGGYWIHVGVLVMAVGIIGMELFQEETQIRLQSGESVTIGNYDVVFNSASQ
ncbi:MAG: heme lyase CcmF/NrfE family subunit, partial [Anaerolineae bacterium]